MSDTSPTTEAIVPRRAGWSGAAAAGLALGITEFAAGLSPGIPSAISSIGAVIVDISPGWLARTAISVLGTADKGALAIGTVVVALVVGAVTGRATSRRPWVGPAVFAAFALVGIAAQLASGASAPAATILATASAAAVGALALRLLLDADRRSSASNPAAAVPGPDVIERRRFVGLLGTVAAGALVATIAGRQLIIRRSEAVRVSAVLPEPEIRVVPVSAEHAFDIPGLTPIVLGEPRFYRVDTALVVPVVDPETWTLKVTGMVDRELELTYDDLLSMPQVERYVTISCVSNPVGDTLVGNAKWQGVRLVDVLETAGVHPDASQIVGRSVDGWTAGFPTAAAFDGRDPLIVVGMNGEPLPRRHGFPARLIVPGLYGYVSATKWLAEIELTTWDAFDGYWIPRGWAKQAPIKTQSRIDRPLFGGRVVGEVIAAGVAWAPTRGIAKVEVQLDDEPWQEAELSEPLSEDAWVQWMLPIDASVGRHRLRVRATDGTGVTQTEERHDPRPDGATGWHTIEFTVA